MNTVDKNKMRAVGVANGRNPIAIIAPCHRVIGASGDRRQTSVIRFGCDALTTLAQAE